MIIFNCNFLYILLKCIIILMEKRDELSDWFLNLDRFERAEIAEEVAEYIARDIVVHGDGDVSLFGELCCLESCLVGIKAGIPKGYELNKKLVRIVENRRKSINEEKNIDWSTAEHLAFGTLLDEGHPVRLSGQDSCRGTFSQRHAVFVDQNNENRYIPLNSLKENQPQFEVIDSPLSEASVLGFEYGFSLTEPTALVMWEAQFGDFANGAQVIVDQFISSGEGVAYAAHVGGFVSGMILILFFNKKTKRKAKIVKGPCG